MKKNKEKKKKKKKRKKMKITLSYSLGKKTVASREAPRASVQSLIQKAKKVKTISFLFL